MDFDPSRLRSGEYVVGVSGVVLAVALFALPWYGLKPRFAPTAAALGVSTTVTGWNGLTQVRWLVLVTVLVAFALLFLQVTRRAPAIPVSLSVIVTVLGILTALALVYRVLLNRPGSDAVVGLKAGSVVGLVSALGLTYGGYLSIRREGIAPKDGPQQIEVVKLSEVGRS